MQGQLAVKSNSHQLIASSKRVDYTLLAAAGTARSWLEAQPELVHLQRTLRLYLAGQPNEGDLAALPRAKGDLVLLHNIPGRSVQVCMHGAHVQVYAQIVPKNATRYYTRLPRTV